MGEGERGGEERERGGSEEGGRERGERQRGGQENGLTYSLSLHPTEAQRSQYIIVHLSRPSNGYTLRALTF